MRLKVLRPTASASEFRAVAESPVVTPPFNSARAFPVRIPVVAGDHLGIYLLDPGSCSYDTRPEFRDHYVYRHGDVPLNAVNTFEDEAGASGSRLSLLAQLEADRDRDGFGDETQDAGLGNDRASGESGNDRLLGGPGSDRLLGGPGNDIITGGTGNDSIDGGDGADTVSANEGNDVISGAAGNDRIFANEGNDKANGNSGKDRLSGGSGRDRLSGGRGRQ